MKKLYLSLIAGALMLSDGCGSYEIGKHHYYAPPAPPPESNIIHPYGRFMELENKRKQEEAKKQSEKNENTANEGLDEAKKELEKAEAAIKKYIEETYYNVWREAPSSRGEQEAVNKIASYGKLAVPCSLDRLKKIDSKEQRVAALALAKLGPENVRMHLNYVADIYKEGYWKSRPETEAPIKSLLVMLYADNKEECVRAVKNSNNRIKTAGLEAIPGWAKNDDELKKLAVRETYECIHRWDRSSYKGFEFDREYLEDFKDPENAAKKLACYGEAAIPISIENVSEMKTGQNVALLVIEGAGSSVDKYYEELAYAYVKVKRIEKYDGKNTLDNVKNTLEKVIGQIFERNKDACIAGSKSDDAELRALARSKLK